MHHRTSTILHKNSGVSLTTPLLIPSFSSKGFATVNTNGKSEIGKILETTSEFLTDVYLVSAYDIYYKHVPPPSELTNTPDLIFVDSGGYEVSTDYDYSSVMVPLPQSELWTSEMLESVYSAWPEQIPAIFVSFDHPERRKPFVDQIADARRLFRRQHQHLTLFLLKPETKEQTTLDRAIKSAVADATELGSFEVIGVTEKELGRTMLDRMAQIAKLRLAMDEAGVTSPLHIFGALDPLTVCLYFIAGAEIFDGLTWLRYAYNDGLCIYTHNEGVVKYGLHLRDDHIRSQVLSGNCYALQSLQQRLREFEKTGDFSKLKPHQDLLLNAFDSLKTKLNWRSQ